jgi:hypothetical protein
MSRLVVLMFIWYPQFTGPPSVLTQAFTSYETCKEFGELLTKKIDVPDTYVGAYGRGSGSFQNYYYDHRKEPTMDCIPRQRQRDFQQE